MFCFVLFLRCKKIKSKMHHSNFTSTWVGNCGTCWLSPVMYSISIALCALITCLFYEQCKMGLECECSGSLSHQTLLTLCTEPVRIHQVAYTLHSPVCTHVSVCACLKERPCVWVALSGESAMRWFPSVCAFVCLSMYKYMCLCAQVCICWLHSLSVKVKEIHTV